MNDEQRTLIGAYHDGELDAAASAAAKATIDADVEARRYLDRLQQTDRMLREAFDPVLDEPLPLGLQAPGHGRRFGRFGGLVLPLALAASLVLVGLLMMRQDMLDQQMHDQVSRLQQQIAQLRQQTLENTPSGTAVSWVDPAGAARFEVTPLQTYRTRDNSFCREYEERIEDATGVEVRRGVACRVGKAQWPDRAGPGVAPPPDAASRQSEAVDL